jgi:hypothetical protein
MISLAGLLLVAGRMLLDGGREAGERIMRCLG